MTLTDVILLIIIVFLLGLIIYFGWHRSKNFCDKIRNNKKNIEKIKKDIEKEFSEYDKKNK